MNENFHNERLDDTRPDTPGLPETAPGERIARQWLRQASRIVGARPPVRSVHRVAGAVMDRYGAVDRHRPTVQAVRERLRAVHPERPPLFSPRPMVLQGNRLHGPPEAPARVEATHRPPEPPGRATPPSPFRRPDPKQRTGPMIPPPAQPVHRDAGEPPAPAIAPDAPLPTGVTQSPPLPLDGQVRNRLAGVLEMRIPPVKIFTNLAADQVARQYGADAVTFGLSILFRAGRYEPETARGLGLLGHELTHAAQPRMPPAAPQAPGAAQAEAREETLARRNEQRILNRMTVFPGMPAAPNSAPVAAKAPPPVMAAGRAAASDRAVNGAGESGPPEPKIRLSATQFRQIRDDVYRDLLDRLRTEFERGG